MIIELTEAEVKLLRRMLKRQFASRRDKTSFWHKYADKTKDPEDRRIRCQIALGYWLESDTVRAILSKVEPQ